MTLLAQDRRMTMKSPAGYIRNGPVRLLTVTRKLHPVRAAHAYMNNLAVRSAAVLTPNSAFFLINPLNAFIAH